MVQASGQGRVYNEFHALCVEAGRRHGKRGAAFRHGCALEEFLPSTVQTTAGRAA